VLMFFI